MKLLESLYLRLKVELELRNNTLRVTVQQWQCWQPIDMGNNHKKHKLALLNQVEGGVTMSASTLAIGIMIAGSNILRRNSYGRLRTQKR
jgi:hypothetical protein